MISDLTTMVPRTGVQISPLIVTWRSKDSSATIVDEPVPHNADTECGIDTTTLPALAVVVNVYFVCVFGSYALAEYVHPVVTFGVTPSDSNHSKVVDASSPRTTFHLTLTGSEPIVITESGEHDI